MPQSQLTERKAIALGSWGGTTCWGGGGVCVEFFQGDPSSALPPRRFQLETPGCGASEVAKPGPPCPPTQGSLGAPAVGWGRGRRRRLPEALSPSPVGCPPPAARPRDHRSPPLPAHFPALRRGQSGAGRVPPGPPPPRSGRSLGVRPPQPGGSGGGRGGDGGGSLVEPLPRGRAAQAQTFPYVVAPRAGAAPGVVVGGGELDRS